MSEPGGANIELAVQLNEEHGSGSSLDHPRIHRAVEFVEALLLAVVAIATAWSGYQSARWSSRQSVLYGQSSRLRVEGQMLETEANQLKLYNALTVVEWLKAEARGDNRLAEVFERRMVGEFRPAFESWKKTDPIHNSDAPAGPFVMPEYQDLRTKEAQRRNLEASDVFAEGTHARERADDYVRVTVFLATVLLLTAISQRFRSHRIRFVLISVAILMLSVPLWRVITLPRL